MVFASKLILEAIKERGGMASVAQTYGHLTKAKGRNELTLGEKGVIRTAILRLKRAGKIERCAPEVYKLLE